MKRIKWLDEKKDEIINLHREEGWTNQQLADHYGVSTCAINTRLRKWDANISDCNRNNRFDLDKETIRYLYWDKEMHPSQIAKIYGCSKQVITNRMKDWCIPSRTKSQARKGRLNPIYNVGHTNEAREKMSQAFVNGRKRGFSSNWGKGSYYNTPNQGKKWMRSGWEIKVADYLTSLGLDWYYEYEWLEIGEGMNYLPDFYIPQLNIYIEVKGRKKKEDMIKFNKSKNIYNILLWDGEELLKMGLIKTSGITEVDRKYRNTDLIEWDYSKYIKN